MKKWISTRLRALSLIGATGALSTAAHAGSGGSSTDSFADWVTTLQSWATGGYGTSVALATLCLGAGTGIARNNPVPALAGVAAAGIMKFGPSVITNVMGYSGALI